MLYHVFDHKTSVRISKYGLADLGTYPNHILDPENSIKFKLGSAQYNESGNGSRQNLQWQHES